MHFASSVKGHSPFSDVGFLSIQAADLGKSKIMNSPCVPAHLNTSVSASSCIFTFAPWNLNQYFRFLAFLPKAYVKCSCLWFISLRVSSRHLVKFYGSVHLRALRQWSKVMRTWLGGSRRWLRFSQALGGLGRFNGKGNSVFQYHPVFLNYFKVELVLIRDKLW